MPSHYTEQHQRDAFAMLSCVHFTSGIPERALRRWRQKILEQADGRMAEKRSAPATGRRPLGADDRLANKEMMRILLDIPRTRASHPSLMIRGRAGDGVENVSSATKNLCRVRCVIYIRDVYNSN